MHPHSDSDLGFGDAAGLAVEAVLLFPRGIRLVYHTAFGPYCRYRLMRLARQFVMHEKAGKSSTPNRLFRKNFCSQLLRFNEKSCILPEILA